MQINDDDTRGNAFDEHFEKIHATRKEAADLERSKNRYAPRPWHLRNKPLFLFAIGVSIACHAITVSASASSVYQFIANLFGGIAIAVVVGILGTLLLLGSVEWLKRWLLSNFWRDYHDPNNYSMEKVYQFGRLSALLLVFTLDMALSWQGSWDFVAMVKDAPAYTPPPLAEKSEVLALYAPQIASAEDAAEDFKKSRSWMGKLDIRDGNKYNALRKDVTDLIVRRDDALEKLASDNAAITSDSKSKYEKALGDYNAALQTQGHILAWVSMASFALLVICLFFVEKYQYRLWFYNRHQKGKIAADPHSTPHHLNGKPVDASHFEAAGKS